MVVEFDSDDFMNGSPERSFWGLFQHPVNRTNKLLEFPDAGMIFQASGHRIIRKIVIGKTKSIFYRVQNSKIHILALHDNRQTLKK